MTRKLLLLGAGIVLGALTITVMGAESAPREKAKTTNASEAAPTTRKVPPSGSGEDGGPRDKAKELAADSKKRHDAARKVIDNLKD